LLLARWDCRCGSRRGHECLSLVIVRLSWRKRLLRQAGHSCMGVISSVSVSLYVITCKSNPLHQQLLGRHRVGWEIKKGRKVYVYIWGGLLCQKSTTAWSLKDLRGKSTQIAQSHKWSDLNARAHYLLSRKLKGFYWSKL
jgi:hypothetical protein